MDQKRKPGRPRGSKSLTPSAEIPTNSNSLPTFSVKDLAVIIETAHKHNVAEVIIGDMHISFHGPAATGVSQSPFQGNDVPVVPKTAAETLTQDQKALREDFYRAQLMLDDPLAYEQMMIDMESQRTGLSETTQDTRS